MTLAGFGSTMDSRKAQRVAEVAETAGHEAVVFDYRGHGQSTQTDSLSVSER